ncbi:MAG: translation elongation factor Ts [Bacilli bacterium]
MITAKMVKELRESTGAGMLDCKKALEETNGDLEKAIDWLREKGISKAAKRVDRIAAEGLSNALSKDSVGVIVEVNSETDFVAKNTLFQDLVNFISHSILSNDVNSLEEALKVKTEEGTIEEVITLKTAKIGERLNFRRFKRIIKQDNEVFGSYVHMGGKIASLVVLENTDEDVAKNVAMHVAAMNPTYLKREEVPVLVLEKEKEIIKEQAILEGKPIEIAEKMVTGKINRYYKDVCLEEQPYIKDDKINVGTYVKNNGGIIKSMIRFEVGEGLEKRKEDLVEEINKELNK